MTSEAQIIETLSKVTTATITTVLLRKGLRNVWIRGAKPLNPGQKRLVGRVFTLRFVPAREDLATPESWSSPTSTRAAIEAMPEGCIAIADAMGVTDAGIFGDILCARMVKKNVAGLITDGVMRDVAGVRATGLPVWCQGVAAPPSVAGLTFAGWQEPIGCGGVAVLPGDMAVVDDDGAVIIPGFAGGLCGGGGAGAGAAGRLDHGRSAGGCEAARPLSAGCGEQGALRSLQGREDVSAARRACRKSRTAGSLSSPMARS